MPKIPFVGPPYLIQSPYIDTNVYLDVDMETKEVTLYQRPGLTKWLDTGILGPVRNIFSIDDQNLYAVVGANVLKISTTGVIKNIGKLLTSTGHVWIEANTHQKMICDGTYGYLIDVKTNFPTFTLYKSNIYQATIGSVEPTFVYDLTNQYTLLQQTEELAQLAAGQWFYDGSSTLYVWLSISGKPNQIIITQASADSFITVPDPNFIGGGSLGLLDTYFITHKPGSSEFAPSAPDDGTNWNYVGTPNFATKEGYSDALQCVFAAWRELWLMGAKTSEIWYDAGNSPFPFAEVPSGFLQTGCGAAASPAIVGAQASEHMYWLTNTRRVARCSQMNYNPEIVSSKRMEYQFAQYAVVNDAIGWRCAYEGREQYHLSFPTEGVTWVYEPATQQWHRRTSYGITGNWRANCCCEFNGMWLVGDYENGIIYQLDSETYQDNGQNFPCIWTLPSVELKGKRLEQAQLDLIVQAGVGDIANDTPNILLSWSNDGEKTFGNDISRNLGKLGQYYYRIRYTPRGMPRQRTYRIKKSGNWRFVLRDVELNEDL